MLIAQQAASDLEKAFQNDGDRVEGVMATGNDKVDAFNPKMVRHRHLETRHYSDADVQAIIEACPKKLHWQTQQRLVHELERAATEYFVASAWRQKPSPLQLRNRMQEIAKAAERLLRVLGLGTKSHTSPDLVPHAVLTRFLARSVRPDEDVRQTIKAVHRIYRWAAAEASKVPKTERSRPRRESDTALDGLILAIAAIWRDVIKLEPRAPYIRRDGSRGKKGQPDGPFFRFSVACLSPLNVNIPPHGLCYRILKLLPIQGKLGSKKT